MALIIPNGFVQISLPITHAGLARQAFITYGAEVGSLGASPGELDEHLDAWMAEITSDSNLIMGPVLGRFGVAAGEPLAMTGTSSANGGSAANRLPSNAAVLVVKQTARGGRRGRGRMYVPWRAEEANVDELGVIDAGNVTGMGAEFDAFLSALETGSRSMVLLHDADGVTAPGSPDVVTRLLVQPVIATQRRRLRS